MHKHKYNLVQKKDIIKELSKETEKTEEFLDEFISLHYKYVHHLIETNETPMIISIPFIGKLCFNYILGNSYLKKNRYDLKVKNMIDKLREILRSGNTTKGMVNPIIFMNAQILCKNFKPSKYNIGAYAKKLEEQHNEWVSKYF